MSTRKVPLSPSSSSICMFMSFMVHRSKESASPVGMSAGSASANTLATHAASAGEGLTSSMEPMDALPSSASSGSVGTSEMSDMTMREKLALPSIMARPSNSSFFAFTSAPSRCVPSSSSSDPTSSPARSVTSVNTALSPFSVLLPKEMRLSSASSKAKAASACGAVAGSPLRALTSFAASVAYSEPAPSTGLSLSPQAVSMAMAATPVSRYFMFGPFND